MFIWLHFIAAVFAIMLGLKNFVSEKGTARHRMVGWSWLLIMSFVTVPSLWIREINDGHFSWIHFLTIWTIISMGIAILSIRKGNVRTHAGFMLGTMLGSVIAGIFAIMPGRFIQSLIGHF